jgi:hypothetical protein
LVQSPTMLGRLFKSKSLPAQSCLITPTYLHPSCSEGAAGRKPLGLDCGGVSLAGCGVPHKSGCTLTSESDMHVVEHAALDEAPCPPATEAESEWIHVTLTSDNLPEVARILAVTLKKEWDVLTVRETVLSYRHTFRYPCGGRLYRA